MTTTSWAFASADNAALPCPCEHRYERISSKEAAALYTESVKAILLYGQRLGTTVLWSARPNGDTPALIPVYNQSIGQNSATLERVFSRLGGKANGVAAAFYNFALTAEAFAAGLATPIAVGAAADQLSNELSGLSSAIDAARVAEAMSRVVNFAGAYVTAIQSGDFAIAEVSCQAAIDQLLALVIYLDAELGLRITRARK